MRAVHDLLAANDIDSALEFFTREFALNAELAAFASRKASVAIWNGIVMGGGAGVSCYCNVRVCTERTTFAMPECAIGLWPDVGAAWFLHRDVGHAFATYLSLTGARVRGYECKIVGLATHYVELSHWERNVAHKVEALGEGCRAEDVAATVSALESRAPGDFAASYGASDEGRCAIEDVFGNDRRKTVEDILREIDVRRSTARNDGERGFWSEASTSMRKASPTSLAVSLELMRRARGQSLEWSLATDNVLIRKFLVGDDFKRGVDAMLIKKTGAPPTEGWSPTSARVVDDYFAGAPESKL